MALYDRNYIADRSSAYETTQSSSAKSVFIRQTYKLFAASLLAASAGSYVGLGMVSTVAQYYWGFVILEFALLFGLQFAKKKEGLNLVMLFAFTFVTGLTIAPLVASFLSRGAGMIVAQAFVLTCVAFGGLSIFAMNTKRDFSAMGKMLFISLLVVVVASIINIFFHSPVLQLAIASIGAILFSAFILYDTQNVIKGAYETPIEGAVALYLDFFNLFISLLQILGAFNSRD